MLHENYVKSESVCSKKVIDFHFKLCVYNLIQNFLLNG